MFKNKFIINLVMVRTLRDCLEDGGIKGKIFSIPISTERKYQVLGVCGEISGIVYMRVQNQSGNREREELEIASHLGDYLD